jgi:Mrp family chromosome partitioning ATPase
MTGKIQRVVAIMSGKGGVGKSSVTALTSVGLKRKGVRVGILDGDMTGPSIPVLFGVEKHSPANHMAHFTPVNSKLGIPIMSVSSAGISASRQSGHDPQVEGFIGELYSQTDWGELDVLLIDLPPGTDVAPKVTLQNLPVDGVIIVSSPQDMAVLAVDKAIDLVKSLNKSILGVVENMSGILCPHCNQLIEVFGKSQGLEVAERHGVPWIGALPMDPNLAAATGAIETYHSPKDAVIQKLMQISSGRSFS